MNKADGQISDSYYGTFRGITIHAICVNGIHLVQLTAPDGIKHIFLA